MTKFSAARRPRGFTLIELMMVVAIISLLTSIMIPRVHLVLQRAYQSTARNDLGSLRSAIALYYSDMSGVWPLAGTPDGYGDAYGVSLSQTLVPKYMSTVTPPHLRDELFSFNGMTVSYDGEASNWFSFSPPKDVAILRGPQGPTPLIDRPYVYDPDAGILYYCNGNYAADGMNRFFEW